MLRVLRIPIALPQNAVVASEFALLSDLCDRDPGQGMKPIHA
jgi:hypothetical protein